MGTSRQPNVILILVDTLRGDHLSCYGHRRHTTPRLDAFATQARLYAAAISPGAWTPPSHASIFTGTYPSRHGVDRAHPYLDASLTTLPEHLNGLGYRTYGVSSNYWIGAATRFDRGFDEFLHSWQLVQAHTNPALERQRRRDPEYRAATTPRALDERARAFVNRCDAAFRRYCCQPLGTVDKGAARVNRVVRRWVREWSRLDAPVFAFIHYMEPHLPYQPPARFRRRHLDARLEKRARAVNQNALKFIGGRARMSAEDFDLLGRLYDAEVSYTDHCVGEVLDQLRAARLLDRSVVIVTSDHGENLGEHGLMDHMFSVHESIVRMPLLVRYPGGEHAGIEDGLVQTHDIFPTVAALTAGANGNGHRNGYADGSLAAQFQGGPLPPFGPARTFAITELNQIQPPIPILARRFPDFDWSRYDRPLRAIRTATDKYIRGGASGEELYAVLTDPGEQHNLSAVHVERAAELRARLDAWEAAITPVAAPIDALEFDADLRQRLEDLGYLQE
jgi:arylsulfatase A-like enzyme